MRSEMLSQKKGRSQLKHRRLPWAGWPRIFTDNVREISLCLGYPLTHTDGQMAANRIRAKLRVLPFTTGLRTDRHYLNTLILTACWGIFVDLQCLTRNWDLTDWRHLRTIYWWYPGTASWADSLSPSPLQRKRTVTLRSLNTWSILLYT